MLHPERHKEYVAWEIFGCQIIGLKIAQISDITDKYVYAYITNRWGKRELIKFSKFTGKEYRPKIHFLHLTQQRIKNGEYGVK